MACYPSPTPRFHSEFSVDGLRPILLQVLIDAMDTNIFGDSKIELFLAACIAFVFLVESWLQPSGMRAASQQAEEQDPITPVVKRCKNLVWEQHSNFDCTQPTWCRLDLEHMMWFPYWFATSLKTNGLLEWFK